MKTVLRIASLAVFICVLYFGCALSQEPAAAPANPAPQAEKKQDAKTQSVEPKKEEDDEQQLKESPMVRKLGNLLGLTVTQAYWVSAILNFLGIAGLIVFALKSNLPRIFRDRTSAIQKGLEEARRASAESATRLADIESRLSRLDSDITQMRSQAEQDSAAEDQRLRAATEEEKKKIVESAEQEIAAAANMARRELKQFAAELAVSLAEKKISVSEAADRILVREFSTHLDAPGTAKGGN